MDWRLGLDLGTNSIGWWAFDIEPSQKDRRKSWQVVSSVDGGVRIFSDGREPARQGRVGDSLAVQRRISRGMRRNRDHGKNRVAILVKDLIRLGLLPEEPGERRKVFDSIRKQSGDPNANNPYRLRSEALERELLPHELGRVLLHLGKRRGFKSNRKEASDEEGGKLKDRIEQMRQTMGNQTLGQYLWSAYQSGSENEKSGRNRPGIRFRGESEFYSDRSMYASEFDAIRARQEKFQKLSDEDWGRLKNKRILFQWPLRPVERGKCDYYPDQPRHWKDTPIAHDFRIHQEINALRWIDGSHVAHSLNLEQRETILNLLMTRKSEVKFASMRKEKRADKSLIFAEDSRFNLEDVKRKGLNPHKFAALFTDDTVLSPLWERHLNDGVLDDVFEILHRAEDDEHAKAELTERFEFGEDITDALIAVSLASGTTSVSRKFLEQVVPVLRDQGLVYSDAVTELKDDAGKQLHHSLREDDRRWPELPYYGEVLWQSMLGADGTADADRFPEKHFGKINNPTVHVALNQTRLLVNSLVKRFGQAPREIHIEVTRDLKLPKQLREKINREQAANQKENTRIVDQICVPLGIPHPSALDIKKVKLWEELGTDSLARQCVFSGQTISAADLFNGEVEIEHILPFSRTLDDSMANLTVAKRWANRLKGNGTPYEAFANGEQESQGIIWAEITERARSLPKNKRVKFSPDAMKNYEKDGGFIARQLNDTAYMSRAAKKYLNALEGVDRIISSPGRLTALARGKWHLNGILGDDNRKDREDHRHHAIDAAVIGLVDQGVLNAVSKLTARGTDDRVRIGIPDLDPLINDDIRQRTPQIIVSYKPDHGLQGRMYNETAYGFIDPEVRDPEFPEHNLVTRKELATLTPKECGVIRDHKLRNEVADWLKKAGKAGEKHDKALANFTKEHGVKRVRMLVTNQTVKPVPSAPYKGYAPDSYVCCDIWRVPKGKPGSWKRDAYQWEGVFWPYAETIGGIPDKATKKPHPAAKFVMRLFKDDLVQYAQSGNMVYARVGGFSTTQNKLDIRPHNLSDAPREFVSVNVLMQNKLRPVRLTPDGRIKD